MAPDIWAYCLMTNHIHLVCVPNGDASLARAMRDVHTAYAFHFNRRYRQTGHLWQGRFFSCPMDEPHLWAAGHYVERNPVRAGLVFKAEGYPRSSAACHCGLKDDTLLSDEFPPPGVIPDWSVWLEEREEPERIEAIRSLTHVGRPGGVPLARRGIRHSPQILPIDIHHIDIFIPTSVGLKRDQLAIGGECGTLAPWAGAGQTPEVAAVRIDHEDVSSPVPHGVEGDLPSDTHLASTSIGACGMGQHKGKAEEDPSHCRLPSWAAIVPTCDTSAV